MASIEDQLKRITNSESFKKKAAKVGQANLERMDASIRSEAAGKSEPEVRAIVTAGMKKAGLKMGPEKTESYIKNILEGRTATFELTF